MNNEISIRIPFTNEPDTEFGTLRTHWQFITQLVWPHVLTRVNPTASVVGDESPDDAGN